MALDWINAGRFPDVDESLKGAMLRLDMVPRQSIFLEVWWSHFALVPEKSLTGLKEEGLWIDEVIAIAGVASKSKLVMQTMADVLGRTIKITASTQTPALGAAMYAAVASGIYTTMDEAILALGAGFGHVYEPEDMKREFYAKRYLGYLALGNAAEEHQTS